MPQISSTDVATELRSFGIDPTPEMISALTGLDSVSSGRDIAQYAVALKELEANQSLVQGDLLSEQESETLSNNLGKILETQGQDSYEQAANIFSQAPKLFGSLTPDQVGTYLQPLQNQLNYGIGQAEGSAASKGLGGSSIEGQAIGQQVSQFGQSVLSQGLGIGQQQQQQQANILTQLGGQQFGAGQQQFGLANNYSGQVQNSTNSLVGVNNDIAGLAPQISNMNAAELAAWQANQKSSSSPLGGLIGTGLGAGVGGIVGSIVPGIGTGIGAGIGASLGGGIGSAVTGNPAGANVGSTAAQPLFLGSYLANQRNQSPGGGGGGGSDTSGLGMPGNNQAF